jgi:hypothetical protein
MMSEKVIQLRERLAGLLPGRRLLLGRALEEQQAAGPFNAKGLLDFRQLPKGGIAELVAENNSSGSALIIGSLLEQIADADQVLTLVDGCDSFNPQGFTNAALSRLLWIRCHDASQALKAADIVLRDRNLSFALLDLQMNPVVQFRKIPSSVWYRLQRIVAATRTSLLVVTPRPMVGSAQVRMNLQSRFGSDALQKTKAELSSELNIEISRNRLHVESSEDIAIAG